MIIRTRISYLVIAALVLFAALSSAYIVKANPSFFVRQNNGVGTTATTSVTYMSPGVATTTKYLDAGVAGVGTAVDSAVLLEQMTGSSTAALLNTTFEYAVYSGTDCVANPTACDWFALELSDQATTTPEQNITTNQTYKLNFASSTQGGALGAGDGRVLKAISVRTPTRYVRAILTLPIGSTNAAVWAEFVGKRQMTP